jgi:hypothetical protein
MGRTGRSSAYIHNRNNSSIVTTAAFKKDVLPYSNNELIKNR